VIYFSDFSQASGGIPFSAVVLLMGFEGANGSTSFVDESSSAHTATAVDNAQISTTTPKFGSGCYLSDGSLDRITFADSADWDFGSGPFTVEAWTRNTNFASNHRPIVGQGVGWGAGATDNAWMFGHNDSTGRPIFRARVVTTERTLLSTATAPTVNTWVHMCAERNAAGKLRLYQDGVMVASDSTNFTGAFSACTQVLEVGAQSIGGLKRAMVGRMDELRIIKGYAVYDNDAGFTPPVAAFPRS
jgi:hypothetical protein